MKAVIFDLFGTLVPNVPPSHFQEIMEAVSGIFDVDPEAYQVEWHKTFPLRMDGRIQDGDEQFLPMLEALGVKVEEEKLKEATVLRRKFMLQALQPKHDALECLNTLQARGFKLALASDCSSETPLLLDRTPLGAFFKVRAISAHLRVRKPDPKMYRHVLDGLSVSGEDCLYVGDGNSEELPGAKQHGMRTVWVDNGGEQHWKDRFVGGGDHRVEQLSELPDLIDALLS